ncbi:hypothetical protein LPB19_12495 [Marinobacter salinisoli]|uniref:Uncharacterized protein n=1 Tax=Marinobacter salinisoli TaxID=2769486 RepID=A0ABX7MUS0_9GAMM|nr:hypothetical protein [Marinobacter salinisoli]QSP94008.1 hypothetical protein LPB19_12495 [Marinobacter salinisoli]
MSDDLLGLGDNDIDALDQKKREDLRSRNPNNEPEVVLSMWTLATLTQAGEVVKKVVFGVVEQCLTDDYQTGDIACSESLIDVPQHPETRIYVSQKLRYECKGIGREVTIAEEEFWRCLPDTDASIDDLKRRLERGEL